CPGRVPQSRPACPLPPTGGRTPCGSRSRRKSCRGRSPGPERGRIYPSPRPGGSPRRAVPTQCRQGGRGTSSSVCSSNLALTVADALGRGPRVTDGQAADGGVRGGLEPEAHTRGQGAGGGCQAERNKRRLGLGQEERARRTFPL